MKKDVIGMTVNIVPSRELSEIKLGKIVWRKGKVVAVGEKNNGYYVKLFEPYQREAEWFIPLASVQFVGEG